MSEWTPEHQALYEMSDQELDALAERAHQRRKPTRAEVLEALKKTDPARYERLYAKAERKLAEIEMDNLNNFFEKRAKREADILEDHRLTGQLTSYRNAWANFMGGQ